MKPRLHISIPPKGITISLGWFGGEPFKLLSVSLLVDWQDNEGWTIVDLQIAKLCFSISVLME